MSSSANPRENPTTTALELNSHANTGFIIGPTRAGEEGNNIEPAHSAAADEPEQAVPREYLEGWRLYILAFATSLISITNALGGFEQRDWVVTAYLITYTGFMIIYAKSSDILGRKLMVLIALGFFTIFSIVCGSISNMIQLIVFRSLQGIGASGIYAMVTISQTEMVPPERWGNFAFAFAIVFVLSSVLGPILGGVINDHSSWRWVFLLNAPAGVIATGLIAFFMPVHFPIVNASAAATSLRAKLTRSSLSRLDVVGAVLLLFASVLLVFALEEAGSKQSWDSPAILSSLVVGVCLFMAFVVWEKLVGRNGSAREPIFSLRLMKDRLFSGLVLVAFFTGFPFMTVLINLPQRFQAVDGASPFQAGIHLLPLLLASPVVTAICGQLAGKFKVPPFYLLLFGTTMQILGIGLASSVSFKSGNAMYGYEVIMGFGFGMGLVTLLVFTPMVVTRSDMAVAMGAVTQVRVLGGTLGLAISSTVLNNHLSSNLPLLLPPEDIKQISDSVQFINTLPETTRDAVRRVFADGYNAQLRVMTYFSAAVWICALLLWENRPRSAATI
ncbi:Uu.00g023980.m01.CDS01 [Anthostomella pinea]|uniref:Uu.00g023980.m01.CDS01 n=1 Tax=Anthostomella pinea TaxID=933095 RepID=A0AAI8W0T4_9PEZI|nr:Uu.00g023980.m01.CDS01 [Anthostomella pinea]